VHARAVGNKYSALLRNSVSSVSRGEALPGLSGGGKNPLRRTRRAEMERSRWNRIMSRLIPHHRAIVVADNGRGMLPCKLFAILID